MRRRATTPRRAPTPRPRAPIRRRTLVAGSGVRTVVAPVVAATSAVVVATSAVAEATEAVADTTKESLQFAAARQTRSEHSERVLFVRSYRFRVATPPSSQLRSSRRVKCNDDGI